MVLGLEEDGEDQVRDAEGDSKEKRLASNAGLLFFKMKKIPHDPEEILAVVDQSNNVIGKATRKEVNEKGLLHREVYIYIKNKDKVLLQKRADNQLWDHSTGGHFPYDQSYEEGAAREVEEELGINIQNPEYLGEETLYSVKPDGKKNNRIARIFLVRAEIEIGESDIDKEEVAEIQYFGKDDLQRIMNSDEKVMTNSARMVLRKYILPLL
ncbi:NUDIX domain-containing protein [Candidatus Woesearchaeota archaeon]|nr:NUDIX domain-containing protein [Candidatus Woesearchaeota archaeon]